jgi:hypothetical protein
MSTSTVHPNASFNASEYRRSIADMFGVLDREAQRELVEKLAVLPRHIHGLAQQGLIAVKV